MKLGLLRRHGLPHVADRLQRLRLRLVDERAHGALLLAQLRHRVRQDACAVPDPPPRSRANKTNKVEILRNKKYR